MKLNRMITMCAITAALVLGASNLFAQNDGGGPGGPGDMGGAGGPGGPGEMGGPGGPGGGNFDPAQMQQRMLQRIQDQLGITNATDWSAIQPLVQKVMDAQRAARGNMGHMFGRGGPGGPGGPGGVGEQSDPAATALQQAIDSSTPTDQIKGLLTKYQASQKAKQAVLATAQDNLRNVLTIRQEAQATLMGLLN